MEQVKKVAVIGAGQMGAGIAQVFAAGGHAVALWDANASALAAGMGGIQKQLARMQEKGKIDEAGVKKILGNITQAAGIKDLATCDLVIEAIIENLEIKERLFKELSEICGENTILASNTSSISITKLAASTKRPERFIGLHFMNPVPVMKLVEVIRGLQTTDAVYSLCSKTLEALGKTIVTAVDNPAFIVNRILCPMVNEAIFLLQEGAKREDIDNAMKLGTNQPMGPLELADFVGLDTLLAIMRILHKELGEDKYRPCPLLVKYVEAGWFGRKTGRGFYTY